MEVMEINGEGRQKRDCDLIMACMLDEEHEQIG
jgi:hypothetical protein